MTLRVFKSAAAVEDLVGQVVYFDAQSPTLANRFLDAFDRTCDLLGREPELGDPCATENSQLPNLRVWQIKGFEQYVVYYRPTAAGVEVFRVLHAARDAPSILGDA